ncbi:MAG: cytochrome c [Dongiaceae bacterium]
MFAAVAAGAAVAVWQWSGKPPRIDPNDPSQVVLGQQLYRAQCAICHGAQLEGQPDWQSRLPSGRLPAPPHDESGHTWHHPDEVLLRIIREGPAFYTALGVQSDMPAFEDTLTDQDIAAILAYIKSRWPQTIRLRQAQMNR